MDDLAALIRELLETSRAATDEEIAVIQRRMADAPFNDEDEEVRVPTVDRGFGYAGIMLGARATASDYHLVKRVIIERQWAVGTTMDEYRHDLRMASLHPSARLATYHDRGEDKATTLTPTAAIVARDRRGRRSPRYIFVVFSVSRDRVLTGYQCSGIPTLRIPKDVRWLR